MSKRYWIIEGYRSTKLFWSKELPYGSFSESGIAALLKCLVAKHGLTDEEVVRAFAKSNASMHARHLEISGPGSKPPWGISRGCNPYFAARVEERS